MIDKDSEFYKTYELNKVVGSPITTGTLPYIGDIVPIDSTNPLQGFNPWIPPVTYPSQPFMPTPTEGSRKKIDEAIKKGLEGLEKSKSALDVQVGGGHYKNYKIQPVEFITKNNLGFCEGNAIKYLCRWREKNGLQDLKKAIHYINLLIELENLEKNG
jgi:hypothetical protein